MNLPTTMFQDILPQAVSVARRQRRVIHGSITFNAKYVFIRAGRVSDADINEVPGNTNLRHNGIPRLLEGMGNGFLERRIGLSAGIQDFSWYYPSLFGVFQVCAQGTDALELELDTRTSLERIEVKSSTRFLARVTITFKRLQPPSELIGPKRCNTLRELSVHTWWR